MPPVLFNCAVLCFDSGLVFWLLQELTVKMSEKMSAINDEFLSFSMAFPSRIQPIGQSIYTLNFINKKLYLHHKKKRKVFVKTLLT